MKDLRGHISHVIRKCAPNFRKDIQNLINYLANGLLLQKLRDNLKFSAFDIDLQDFDFIDFF